MARFCGNCGTMVGEEAKVCGNCGTPLQSDPVTEFENASATYEAPVGGYEAPAYGGTSSNQDGMKKIIGLIIGLLVAIGLVISGVKIISANTGTNAIIRQFAKCLETGEDGSKLEKYLPNYLKEAEMYDSFEVEGELEEQFIDLREEGEEEYGDYSVSYKIIKTDKMDDEELEDYRDRVEYINDEFDVERITAGKNVKVRFTIRGDMDDERETIDMSFIKEDGKWKIDIYSLDI